MNESINQSINQSTNPSINKKSPWLIHQVYFWFRVISRVFAIDSFSGVVHLIHIPFHVLLSCKWHKRTIPPNLLRRTRKQSVDDGTSGGSRGGAPRAPISFCNLHDAKFSWENRDFQYGVIFWFDLTYYNYNTNQHNLSEVVVSVSINNKYIRGRQTDTTLQ